MHLWHVQGSLPIEPRSRAFRALNAAAAAIGAQGYLVKNVDDRSLVFASPQWLGIGQKSWRPLFQIDEGEVWLDEQAGKIRLSYNLRMLDILVFCLILALAFGVMLLARGHSLRDVLLAVSMPVVWIYGLSYMLAQIRVRLFFRRLA